MTTTPTTLTPTSNPPRAPMWPAALMALAGAAVGGLFGFAATAMYGVHDPGDDGASVHYLLYLGPALGAVSGAAVGVAWWLVMRRLAGRAPGIAVVAAGTGLGVAAGVASTVFLHVVLGGVTGNCLDPDWLLALGLCIGLAGAPAGLVTGLVSGIIVWAATAIARQRRPCAAAAGAEAPGEPPPNP